VKDAATKEPFMEATQAVNAATLKRGLITIRAGLFSNCVRFLPPLDLDEATLSEALDVFDLAIDEVAAR
jgi:4-aminobutyrate aminotransferase/(S)-3-amino-2-methylpropionate transaminase